MRLKASACRCRSAKLVGTFASFVLTTRPMFSITTGAPYSFLTAVPYENASSVYPGNFAFTAARGFNGSTSPLAARSPVQSWAPTITSGAVSACTVLRSSRILPKSFCTTTTLTPRDEPHADAILSTAGFRSASVQIVTVVAASRDAPTGPARARTASAMSAPGPTRRNCFFMLFLP